MAEGKDKIIVYKNWKKTFDILTDDEAGKLIKHFFAYVSDENPILDDRLLQVSWSQIEETLKRDLKRWEKKADINRENGKKGGRPKNPKEPKKPTGLNGNPKKGVSVSVSVSDSVSVNNDVYMHQLANNKEVQGMFIEGIYMRHKLKPKSIGKILPEFNNQLSVDEKVHKNLDEYKKHFGNWMNTQDTIKKLDQYKR